MSSDYARYQGLGAVNVEFYSLAVSMAACDVGVNSDELIANAALRSITTMKCPWGRSFPTLRTSCTFLAINLVQCVGVHPTEIAIMRVHVG